MAARKKRMARNSGPNVSDDLLQERRRTRPQRAGYFDRSQPRPQPQPRVQAGNPYAGATQGAAPAGATQGAAPAGATSGAPGTAQPTSRLRGAGRAVGRVAGGVGRFIGPVGAALTALPVGLAAGRGAVGALYSGEDGAEQLRKEVDDSAVDRLRRELGGNPSGSDILTPETRTAARRIQSDRAASSAPTQAAAPERDRRLTANIEAQGLPASGRIGTQGRIGRTIDPETGAPVSNGVNRYNQGLNPLDFDSGTGFIRRGSDGNVTRINTNPERAPKISRSSNGGATLPATRRGRTAADQEVLGAHRLNFAAPTIAAGTNRLARNQDIEASNARRIASGEAITAGAKRALDARAEARGQSLAERESTNERTTQLLEATTQTENPELARQTAQSAVVSAFEGNDPAATRLLTTRAADALQKIGSNVDLFGDVNPFSSGRTLLSAISDFVGGRGEVSALGLTGWSVDDSGNIRQPNGRDGGSLGELDPDQRLYVRALIERANQG